jgi:hypothetical protein
LTKPCSGEIEQSVWHDEFKAKPFGLADFAIDKAHSVVV